MVRKILISLIFSVVFFSLFLSKAYAACDSIEAWDTSAGTGGAHRPLSTDTQPPNIHIVIHGDENFGTDDGGAGYDVEVKGLSGGDGQWHWLYTQGGNMDGFDPPRTKFTPKKNSTTGKYDVDLSGMGFDVPTVMNVFAHETVGSPHWPNYGLHSFINPGDYEFKVHPFGMGSDANTVCDIKLSNYKDTEEHDIGSVTTSLSYSLNCKANIVMINPADKTVVTGSNALSTKNIPVLTATRPDGTSLNGWSPGDNEQFTSDWLGQGIDKGDCVWLACGTTGLVWKSRESWNRNYRVILHAIGDPTAQGSLNYADKPISDNFSNELFSAGWYPGDALQPKATGHESEGIKFCGDHNPRTGRGNCDDNGGLGLPLPHGTYIAIVTADPTFNADGTSTKFMGSDLNGHHYFPFCYTIFNIEGANPIPGKGTCLPATGICKQTTLSDKSGTCGCGNTCVPGVIDSITGLVTSGLCLPESSFASLYSDYTTGLNVPNWLSPTPICDQNGDQYICHTAIGDIDTSPGGFVQAIMGFILSIAGGIAVLLIIISGYRMMVSQGNPENIKNAKDQLTAAIIGLLFIIFSLVILQIIGFNILGLPGFNP